MSRYVCLLLLVMVLVVLIMIMSGIAKVKRENC